MPCKIVSLTWAKALGSPVSHEYIQFIVEDTETGKRTRVLTDRHKDHDYVLVGWNWAAPKNPSEQPDIPLPLLSLDIVDAEKRPGIMEMAEIFKTVTDKAPCYSIFSSVKTFFKTSDVLGNMCWWYARSVYDTVKYRFGAREKVWKWAKLRYSLLIFKADYEPEGMAFKDQNVSGMSYQRPMGSPEVITQKDYLDPIIHDLQNEQTMQDYEMALQIDGDEKLNNDAIEKILQSVQNSQSNKAPAAKTRELVALSDKFSEAILSEPDAEANIEGFTLAWEKRERQEKGIPDNVILTGMRPIGMDARQKESSRFEEAMRAYVGGILRSLDGQA